MRIPTQAEILAGGRHVFSYLGGAFSMFAALHIITAGDAASAVDALNKIGSGAAEVVAGVGTLTAVVMGAYATISANPLWQLITGSKAVAADPKIVQSFTDKDQAVVAQAAQEMPKVQAVIAAPEVAQEAPSPNVIPTTDVEVIKK